MTAPDASALEVPQEPPKSAAPESLSDTGPYAATSRGIVWYKELKDKTVEVLLANFDARIIREVLHDDGVEERRVFEIEVALRERQYRIQVPASRFSSMTWPVELLGADAVVYAGYAIRDHLRVAIHKLSGDVPKHRVYQHTGWRSTSEHGWVYLHHGGGISAEGLVTDIAVKLDGTLVNVVLPAPPTGDTLKDAIRACLSLDAFLPDRLTMPVRAATTRAALGPTDFGLFFSGPSGTGKTEIVALAQQHYGVGFDARALPASWSSTENALEDLTFTAKDMVLVIDDFSPTGGGQQIQQLHAKAERIFRAVGNRTGRQRMRSDLTQVPPRPPRGLVLATGEDVPRGHSLNARMLHLPVHPDDMDWDALTLCQADAAAGAYAAAMAGFLRWLAPQYETVQATLRTDVAVLRTQISGGHRRSPTMAADLGIGLRYWTRYVVEMGVLTDAEGHAYWERGWQAICAAVTRRDEHQVVHEPASQFISLLRTAFVTGRAYVTNMQGGAPEQAPEGWGWKPAGSRIGEYVGQGRLIGWLDGDALYVEPQAAFAVVRQLGVDIDTPIAISLVTLKQRLQEKGHLVQTDHETDRETYTVRKTVSGVRRNVLYLDAPTFLTGPQERTSPNQSNPTNPTAQDTGNDPVGKVGSNQEGESPTHDTDGDGTAPESIS